MTEIGPNQLKTMATAYAASIPPYLDRPTIPPQAWHQEGEIVTVILADGRKVSANIQAINALMFEQHVGTGLAPVHPAKPVHAPAPVVKPEKPAKPTGKGRS